jgi:prevent-host-death family protein
MASWAVAEAKAKFSEVVEQALNEGPQEITRNGKQAVTVISTKDLEKLRKPKQSLSQFLLNSPLRGSGLTIPKRGRWKARPVKF